MAEPSTSALSAAVVGVTAASLIPGIDVNAVIGGFAGAMFFVVFAKDLTPWSRLGYFVASWVLGYYMSSEVIDRNWTSTSGLVAFFGALFCVAVCISLLEWVQGGKPPGWVRFITDRFGGRRG